MNEPAHPSDARILWADRINRTYPGLSPLCSDPPIFRIADFVTEDECDQLITRARGRLARSPTVDHDRGVVGSVNEGRTSSTCFLNRDEAPWLLAKVSALTNKPVTHMETPQVCHYEAGAYYHAHHDAVDLQSSIGQLWVANGGQRLITVLIYINDVPRGGKTLFNELNLYSLPIKGTALVFFPGFSSGDMDQRVLHEADTAIDEKWVVQIWIRQKRWVQEKEAAQAKPVSSPEVMVY